MPYVYKEVTALQGHAPVGNGDCVALAKDLTPGLKGFPTSAWRAGAAVTGSTNLARGTAIATFERGRYPNKTTGNHAAFFLAYGGKGIWVMDQWKNDPINKPGVSRRYIPLGLTKKDGSIREPSNAAQAFYVIELP